jgi:hypothetical protein
MMMTWIYKAAQVKVRQQLTILVCVVFIATYEKFHLGEQYMDEVKKPYF